MPMNKSYLTALIIFAAIVLLFAAGTLMGGGNASTRTAVEETAPLFQVVTRRVEAQPRPAILALRGRTEAFREVVVRAETGGRVVETPALEGGMIAAGDVMCRLDVDARAAALDQAEADLRARQLEYDAAVELSARGHRSANQVAALEAARDAARAQLQAAREEIANIELKAPFDGIFDGRIAEIGDYLRPGDPCGTVVQLDPILIVAEVAERDVSALTAGMAGRAELVTGDIVDGQVRFVERRADPATRTFRVELEAPNPEGRYRSGVTADIAIPLAAAAAHRVPTSVLTLNASGDLGVRIVTGGDTVRFLPVELLSDDGEEVWVSGLPAISEVIVLGQEFVSDGTIVEVAPEEAGQ
ncbi:efflux RND transporter periplasmic adaptor subunit [Maricaulis sp.]|uniref:efflux RND transporter periplasmic adaptor subunit n=1 Tax=Maricaulis sp. TaxID=1486257 RepID=UPI00263522CE|nr:efflux RND transporter periplasmic adaptor subunit [Maricaulis sp.]